ncbi:MAG: hypothetical protein PWQ15_1728 [Methanobacterium sp.]|jgi:hypothetical protein|nr:hypothetical protein [Methanobacterium sp.]
MIQVVGSFTGIFATILGMIESGQKFYTRTLLN